MELDWQIVASFGVLITILFQFTYKIPYQYLKDIGKELHRKVQEDLFSLVKQSSTAVKQYGEVEFAQRMIDIASMKIAHQRALAYIRGPVVVPSVLFVISGFFIGVFSNSASLLVLFSLFAFMTLLVLLIVVWQIFAYEKLVKQYMDGEDAYDILNNSFIRV